MIAVGTKIGVRYRDSSGNVKVVRGAFDGHTKNNDNKDVMVVKESGSKYTEIEMSRVETIVPL